MSGAACAKIILCGPPAANAAYSLQNIAEFAAKGSVVIAPDAFTKAAILIDSAIASMREAEKTLIMGIQA